MRIEQVSLTPDLAKVWLAQNRVNRTLRTTWVEYLAGEMRRGNWQVNGDTFVFDKEGELVDGQHRAQAVIDAEYSYQATVVYDVSPDARLTIDDPRLRRFSDDLTMNGQANTVQQEALLRKINTWNGSHGFASKQDRVSRTALAELYPLYAKDIRKAIEEAHRFWRAPASQSILQFMIWLLHQYGPEDMVEKYFSILAIGSQDSKDATLVRLRNRLQALKDEPQTRGANKSPLTATMIYFMIRGWNSWVSGSVTQFSLPSGGLSDPYPVPLAVEKNSK